MRSASRELVGRRLGGSPRWGDRGRGDGEGGAALRSGRPRRPGSRPGDATRRPGTLGRRGPRQPPGPPWPRPAAAATSGATSSWARFSTGPRRSRSRSRKRAPTSPRWPASSPDGRADARARRRVAARAGGGCGAGSRAARRGEPRRRERRSPRREARAAARTASEAAQFTLPRGRIERRPIPAWSLPPSAVGRIAIDNPLPERVDRDWAIGGATGKGVQVCILDSGVEPGHPLVGRAGGRRLDLARRGRRAGRDRGHRGRSLRPRHRLRRRHPFDRARGRAVLGARARRRASRAPGRAARRACAGRSSRASTSST